MRRLAVLLVLAAIPTWAADPDLMKLVMPNAQFIAGIHVAQLKKTAFGQFILSEFSASQDREFDGFVKASGFDPRYNLTISSSPARARTPGILCSWRAAPSRRIASSDWRAAQAHPLTSSRESIIGNGAAASALPHGAPFAVAFLSGSIALAGDHAAVRRSIGRAAARAPAPRPR